MRCSCIAGLRRMGMVVLSIAALSAVLIASPALARSHGQMRYLHHVHFAKRHRLAVRAARFTPYPNVFQPFASEPYGEPRGGSIERGLMRTSLVQSQWRQDNWHQDNWRENQWSENRQSAFGGSSEVDGMAAQQASTAGLPVSLVERVIKRESGGNPRAVSRGNYGLMQIRLGTARAMGYGGAVSGLLDPQTNMTYAVRYLAGAYRAAGGNENRAIALYARGYYGVAKAQGFSPYGTSSTMAANTFAGPNLAMYQPTFTAEDQFASAGRYTRRHYHRHPA